MKILLKKNKNLYIDKNKQTKMIKFNKIRLTIKKLT